jgi:L-aspartate semialdehyde sulfurtransferase ferredoxin
MKSVLFPQLPGANFIGRQPGKKKNMGQRVAKKAEKPARKPVQNNGPQKARLWLMYPPRLITNPIIWELGHRFAITTNVRQASVTDEIGIVCLELEGERNVIKDAIKWLEKAGVKVEPIEINVIES